MSLLTGLVPGLGIVKGMALTLRRFFAPEGDGHVPGDAARTSRRSSAAGSSCCTTSTAASSARRASSAPRPARSSASTWAAWTRRAGSTSTGARPRRTASGARNPRCAAPAGACRTRPSSTSRRSTSRRWTRSSSVYDHDPKRMLPILEATQATFGFLPVAALKRISERTGAWYADDLRHRHVLRPPALRAAIGRRPRRRRSAPGARPTRATLARARRLARRQAPGRRRVSAILPSPKELAVDPAARAGAADPADLDDALKAGAFEGLRRAVRELGPDGTIAEVEASGLRGRGGAGHLTAEKWQAAAETAGEEPLRRRERLRRGPVRRARTGRSSRPTRTRSSRASPSRPSRSARRPATSPSARPRPRRSSAWRPAIEAATSRNFIGEDALGSGRRIEIEVRPVQGAYMLGEETVLLKALDGKRGQPEQRPPHPATRGFRNAPTVVQNVQTLASVPWILRNGAKAFKAIGLGDGARHDPRRRPRATSGAAWPRSRSGRRSSDIVALGGKPAKGQSSRPWSSAARPAASCPRASSTRRTRSRTCAPSAPTSARARSIAADDRACVVDLARLLTRFSADEACGKTIPCRIGLAAHRRDRRAPLDRDVARRRPRAARRPLRRRRRLRTLRP